MFILILIIVNFMEYKLRYCPKEKGNIEIFWFYWKDNYSKYKNLNEYLYKSYFKIKTMWSSFTGGFTALIYLLKKDLGYSEGKF